MRYRFTSRRPGAIAPLTALLTTIFLGMVAFAVDFGWIVLAEDELQNAADAAALAGADPLMDGYVKYQLPKQNDTQRATIKANAMVSARARAKDYAALNYAGGVSLTLLDADIEFGIMDAAGTYRSLTPTDGFPNTIKVVVRRDAVANGSLNLFFAPVLGTAKSNLQATASATCYGGVINSFAKKTTGIGMLPMTYDVDHWDEFLKTGRDSDNHQDKDSDGNPVLGVYPSTKYVGNFGELALDDDHAGSSEIRGWINDPLTTNAVDTLKDRSLIPLSAHDPNTWDWLGNPGFKASTVQEVNLYQDKTFLLPLFKAYNSNQNNYQAGVGGGSDFNYNIVRFVGVRIADARRINREIAVQPAAVIEPNAVFEPGSVAPLGMSTTFTTTFTTPKLTR